MSQPVILGVSEIAFWVKDVEAAADWYQANFGLTVQEHVAGKHAFLRAGDLLIVLFNPNDPGTQLGREYLERTGGPRGDVYHVAFRLDPDALDSTALNLKSKGVEIKGPIEFDSGRRSYFLEDIDKHYIELTDC